MVKFEGNGILSIDDFDVFTCYRDLWKTKSEKHNAVRQGIIHGDSCTENCIRLRIKPRDKSASNTRDNAIANAYEDKFIISLNFEMLHSMIPYYQSGLGNKLCYEPMFNDYDQIILST